MYRNATKVEIYHNSATEETANMGKIKKNIANEVKQRRPRSKKHKTELVFDEKQREEYLTGFSKRKQERKKKAHLEIIGKLKEEKKQIKIQRREELDKKWKALDLATDLDAIVEPKTIDMTSHTVTVTDVSEVDFVGGAGFMLGTNQGLYQKSDEEEEGEEGDEDEDGKKKKLKIGMRKYNSKKHKNFSHSMSNKNRSKKRHMIASQTVGKPKKTKAKRNAR